MYIFITGFDFNKNIGIWNAAFIIRRQLEASWQACSPIIWWWTRISPKPVQALVRPFQEEHDPHSPQQRPSWELQWACLADNSYALSLVTLRGLCVTLCFLMYQFIMCAFRCAVSSQALLPCLELHFQTHLLWSLSFMAQQDLPMSRPQHLACSLFLHSVRMLLTASKEQFPLIKLLKSNSSCPGSFMGYFFYQ